MSQDSTVTLVEGLIRALAQAQTALKNWVEANKKK